MKAGRMITVRVTPKASRSRVEEAGGVYKVYCTQAPAGGRANVQAIELLADHLNLKKYRLKIIRGSTCRTKIVEIIDE
ncbi:MAG: DUF167 domain-containing protein [Candidatus Omnitrophica bacterium]|jgi:hypothetical protein|nr:DUF167 domain-containing protein [Candidatus Omnitrophota bacterium]